MCRRSHCGWPKFATVANKYLVRTVPSLDSPRHPASDRDQGPLHAADLQVTETQQPPPHPPQRLSGRPAASTFPVKVTGTVIRNSPKPEFAPKWLSLMVMFRTT